MSQVKISQEESLVLERILRELVYEYGPAEVRREIRYIFSLIANDPD